MDKLSFTTSNIERIKEALKLIALMDYHYANEENFVVYGYKVEDFKPTEEQIKFGVPKGKYLMFTRSESCNMKSGYCIFPTGMHLDTIFNFIKDWFNSEDFVPSNFAGDGYEKKAITIEAGDLYALDHIEDFHVKIDTEYIGK